LLIFADGYHDAVNLRDQWKWSSPLEGLRAGIVLHRLEGIVRAKVCGSSARMRRCVLLVISSATRSIAAEYVVTITMLSAGTIETV
jgi:hypothetical protein